MTGNIWEFVRSATSPDTIWVRGGAFYEDAVTHRLSNRWPSEPNQHDRTVGTRLCIDAPGDTN
jgi:hypothetical protein